jgi:hypothetical protein
VHGARPPERHLSRKGRAARRKGARNELALVRYLQDHGFAAEKTSRTGYTGTDLSMPLLGVDRRVEVKCRGDGFKELYKWLTGADLLIVRSDRHEPLVVLPLKFAAEIAMAAEGNRALVVTPIPLGDAPGGPSLLFEEGPTE